MDLAGYEVIFFRLSPTSLANCNASELVPNAADLGDCTSALPSSESCTNTAFSGSVPCTASTCFDGVLTPGSCPGARGG